MGAFKGSSKGQNRVQFESLENRRLLSAGQVFYAETDGTGAGSLATVTTAGQNPEDLGGGLALPTLATDGTNIYTMNEGLGPGNSQGGYIEELDTSGNILNSSVVGNLLGPGGSTVSASDLFVMDDPTYGDVSEYTKSGQLVHSSFITNVAGGTLFVDGTRLLALGGTAGVAAYNISTGALISSSFITPTASSGGGYSALAISGNEIFTASSTNTIDEFNATTGALIKEDLFSVPAGEQQLAVDNNEIFVYQSPANKPTVPTMQEYSLTGTLEATVDLPSYHGGSPYGLIVMGLSGAPLTNSLAFTSQPTTVQQDQQLGTVTVQISNPSGGATGDNSPVTLSLSGGTAGAVLSGTTTVAAVNGVATFTGLSITPPGDGYVFTAMSGAYQSAVSSSFSIIPKSVLSPTFGKSKVPNSVVTGLPWGAKLPVVLSNTGSLVHGQVTVNLFANTSPTLDGNQVLLKSVDKKNLVVKAGHKAVIGISIPSLAADFTPGTYYLIAQVVDPLNHTASVATTQTIDVAAPNVAGTVALDVSETYKAALGQSQIVNLTITVTNTGNVVMRGQRLSVTSTYNLDQTTTTVAQHAFGPALRVSGTRTFKLRYRTTKATAAGLYFMLAGITVAGSGTLVQGSAYLDLSK